MGAFQFKPVRSQSQPLVITDLDALISKPIAFKFQGEIFTVKPVDTGTYLKVADGLGQLQALTSQDQANVKREDIDQAYFNLLSNLCDDLKISHIQKMTVAQINALLRLIVRHLTGETEKYMQSDDSAQKKNQLS